MIKHQNIFSVIKGVNTFIKKDLKPIIKLIIRVLVLSSVKYDFWCEVETVDVVFSVAAAITDCIHVQTRPHIRI